MEPIASAALTSWTIDWRAIALLLAIAFIYLRGWLRSRTLLHDERDATRLMAFLAGLTVLFVATESPLDAFDGLYLSAHMAQHLLLLMIAPPLILLGNPTLPLLRGIPRKFVKEGLGPFLSWKPLKQILARLTTPISALALFILSTVLWHLPKLYELALSSPNWHAAQHASFFWTGILFWWPVIQPGPGKPRWPKWMAIPYLLFADIVNTALSAFFVFSGSLLYPSYAAGANHAEALADQSLAGLIMWVPGSIAYLVPAFVLMIGLFSSGREQHAAIVRVKRTVRPVKVSLTRRVQPFRRPAQVVVLLLALAIIADGFFGTQVAALNMAGVLPWIHWRALSVMALLLMGNLFCMACPFTLVRDLARKVLPARLRWPHALRTKWLAAFLFTLYLWAYEAFSLWDSPYLTAWVIVGYFAGAILVDGTFRGASFCKYVCPIGQFHFLSSLVSPREVAVRTQQICQSCSTHDCIRGNDQARGCELYLFQPKKASNLDCTFCLDCVKACPHDNIALLPAIPAKTLILDSYRSSLGRLSKRTDLAFFALLFVFAAFVNAAGMVTPVMFWEHRWHTRWGAHAMPLIAAAFIAGGAVMLPTLLAALCWLVNGRNLDSIRRFAFVLTPIGIAMWAAHAFFHLAVHLGVPSITPLQILLLDAGLLLTLYVGWQVADKSFRRWTPWAAIACGLYSVGIWILFQPMEMRGMIH